MIVLHSRGGMQDGEAFILNDRYIYYIYNDGVGAVVGLSPPNPQKDGEIPVTESLAQVGIAEGVRAAQLDN